MISIFYVVVRIALRTVREIIQIGIHKIGKLKIKLPQLKILFEIYSFSALYEFQWDLLV